MLTERFFKNSSWPDAESIQAGVGNGKDLPALLANRIPGVQACVWPSDCRLRKGHLRQPLLSVHAADL